MTCIKGALNYNCYHVIPWFFYFGGHFLFSSFTKYLKEDGYYLCVWGCGMHICLCAHIYVGTRMCMCVQSIVHICWSLTLVFLCHSLPYMLCKVSHVNLELIDSAALGSWLALGILCLCPLHARITGRLPCPLTFTRGPKLTSSCLLSKCFIDWVISQPLFLPPTIYRCFKICHAFWTLDFTSYELMLNIHLEIKPNAVKYEGERNFSTFLLV